MFHYAVFAIIICTVSLPSSCYGNYPKNVSVSDVKQKLEDYNHAQRFFKVLSWTFNENVPRFLNDIVIELDPTVIAIQNISVPDYQKLVNENVLQSYEVSGIEQGLDEADAMLNPIFFKGDRLDAVVDEDKFTGVTSVETGSVSWSQFKIKDIKPKRKKRDAPEGSIMALIFSLLQDEKKECNIPGSIVIANVNLNREKNSYSDFKDLFEKPIYQTVMCQRNKRSLLLGNLGWAGSYKYVYENFTSRKKMYQLNTYGSDVGTKNINQIWSHDFNEVTEISTRIDFIGGDYLSTSLEGSDRDIAPTFAVFHSHNVM